MRERPVNLVYRFVSDLRDFTTRQASDELDELGREARDTGDDLEQLGRDAADADRDIDRLDPGDAGDDLERMGRDARDAGDDLERLGRDSRDAGEELERFARDARDAGDDAAEGMDRARRAGEDMGDGARQGAARGREAMSGMSEEASGTALEMSASFDGTSASVQDAMQEMSANVLATLGPLGAGAGVALGVFVGTLRANAEEVAEETGRLTEALIDDGGKLSRGSVIDQLSEFAKDGTLNELADAARGAEIDVSDFLDTMAGDPEQAAALDKQLENIIASKGVMSEQGRAAGKALAELRPMAEAQEQAAKATEELNTQLGASPATFDEFGSALEEFVDPAGTYTDLMEQLTDSEQERAEKVAESTADASDSWEDHVQDVKVSTKEYLKELEKQVKDQEKWAGNMATLARRGVSDGVIQELSRMGPEGAPLVADLVKASDGELAKLNGLMERRAKSGVEGLEQGFKDGKGKLAGTASSLGNSAADAFAKAFGDPRHKGGLESALSGTLAMVNAPALKVPVKVDQHQAVDEATKARDAIQATLNMVRMIW